MIKHKNEGFDPNEPIDLDDMIFENIGLLAIVAIITASAAASLVAVCLYMCGGI
ncbi:MAG: hypothetical protein HUJ97_08005 [Bacteroidales bacterium]|nr:hypothetical protein [Bacteroidales bacterium]